MAMLVWELLFLKIEKSLAVYWRESSVRVSPIPEPCCKALLYF